MVTSRPLSVLMVTSEWPTAEQPLLVPFIVQQVRFLREAGVEVDVFPFRGARSPGNYVRSWRSLQRRVGAGHHDLIHAQFGQAGALAVLPKRRPLVVTFRGDDLEGIVGDDGRYLLAGRVLRRLSQLAALRADATIVVADHLARHLPRRPSAVIPSGIDLEVFRPIEATGARSSLGLPAGEKLVLFVGDPDEARKRVSLAEQAARMAGADLVVAWDKPRDAIPVYMGACDALVFTSMHEGSPNVVKEALACDLPVVSVDVGDVRERLAGVEGCVVSADDRPETLAEALRGVLDRGGRVDGRAAVRDLDEAALTARVVEVYEGVLARAGRGRRAASLTRGG
ncbi:MAG: glycosyltransferase [Actinomycetota bacterium]|nr:glycosyltransferase [Actinomycetota bacterium]